MRELKFNTILGGSMYVVAALPRLNFIACSNFSLFQLQIQFYSSSGGNPIEDI